MMVSNTIMFDALKNKISEKLVVDHERYELCMKYLSPLSRNLPPFDINDNDDLVAFMFLSIKSAKDGVLAIEIYTSLKLKNNDYMDEQGFEEKPFNYEAVKNAQEMDVPLTAPHIIHSQNFVVEGDTMQDDRTLDGVLEDENNRLVMGDRIESEAERKRNNESCRKWFCQKSTKSNVVALRPCFTSSSK